MISLVMPHLKQELILEPAQVPVDSADSRVAAMAAIQEFHFNGENMDDIFGDIFGNMFHGSHGEKPRFRQQWHI